MRIKYMKIRQNEVDEMIDWSLLYTIAPRAQTAHCVLTLLENPLDIRFDGRSGMGAILMPPADNGE